MIFVLGYKILLPGGRELNPVLIAFFQIQILNQVLLHGLPFHLEKKIIKNIISDAQCGRLVCSIVKSQLDYA
jgi:hypothetical protein